MDAFRNTHNLNIFFGESSLKNKTFTVQQGDYNSNEIVANLYDTDESGASVQMDLTGLTATVVFKKENGRPTPEYSVTIDETRVGRVSFCIPQRIQARAGDAVFQLRLYGDDSLLNSVVLSFKIAESISDCGHGDGCKPVTLTVLQKVEAALEELNFMKEEFDAAEAERSEQFDAWEDLLSNVQTAEREVVNKATHYDFPSVGDVNVVYKAESERKLYQWNPNEQKYEPLIMEAETIDTIDLIYGGDATDGTD